MDFLKTDYQMVKFFLLSTSDTLDYVKTGVSLAFENTQKCFRLFTIVQDIFH